MLKESHLYRLQYSTGDLLRQSRKDEHQNRPLQILNLGVGENSTKHFVRGANNPVSSLAYNKDNLSLSPI